MVCQHSGLLRAVGIAALIAAITPFLFERPAAAIPAAVPPGCQESPGSASNTTPVAIPDNAAPITSTINVPATGALRWVRVRTDIAHTFTADLDVTLTSPAGTVVTLTTDNGAGNDNVFAGTLWDDDAGDLNAPGAVTDATFANGVTETPLVPEESLGAFVGEEVNGSWVLGVADDTAAGIGMLNGWSLEFGVNSGAALFPSTATLSSTAVAPITDNLTTTQTFQVSERGGVVEDVDLTTNITHTFANDLDITLTSPAGTVVTLTTDNGSSADDVFNGTLWNDNAGATNPPGPVTDTVFANLTTATPLVAEEALSAFRGEDPNGTWTLAIADDLNGDQGSSNGWGLGIRSAWCGAADLGVTGTGTPGTVQAGDTVAQTFTVHNSSIQPAEGVTLADALPAGLELLSATPSQGTCSGSLSCSLGTLHPGDAAQVAVVAGAPVPGTVTNTASVNHSQPDPDASDDSAGITTTVNPRPAAPSAPSGEDTVPQLELLLLQDRLRTVRSRGLTALTAATQAGTLVLDLQLDARTARRLRLPRRIGRVARTLSGPATARVRVRLTRRAARALQGVRRARVTLVGTLTDADGDTDSVRRSATVR